MLIYTCREKKDGLPEAAIHNVASGITYVLEVDASPRGDFYHQMPALSLAVVRPGSGLDQDYGYSPMYYGQEAMDFWEALLTLPFADKFSPGQKRMDLSGMWAQAMEISLRAVQREKEYENEAPF